MKTKKDNENALIKLPSSDLAQMANILAISDKLLPAFTGKTIMLVDGNRDIHKFYIDEIKEVFGNKIKAISFYNSLSAYEYLRKNYNSISLIVHGKDMSVMTEQQLLEKCQGLNPSLPFVFCYPNTPLFKGKGVRVGDARVLFKCRIVDIKKLLSPLPMFTADEYVDEFTLLKTLAKFLFPNDAEVYFNLGYTYNESGMYKEAIEAYKQAIRIKPDFAEAYYNLGGAYSESGMYKEAIEAYKQAIRIKPGFAEAYFEVGVAYGKSGMYKEAIEALKQVIRIKPDYAKAYSGLGYAYGKSGMYKEAVDACKQAIKIEPNYHHSDLGCVYGELGMYKEAIEAFKQAIMSHPDFALNRFNLGCVYGKAGMYKEAIDAFKQTITDHAEASYYNLGRAYSELGMYKEAIESYMKIKFRESDVSCVSCVVDSFGEDSCEVFSEETTIYINKDHPIYKRESGEIETNRQNLARLIAQEIALSKDPHNPRPAFEMWNQFKRSN